MNGMTSRERILSSIHHEEPDRVPLVFEFSSDVSEKGPLCWKNQFDRAYQLLELGIDPVIDIWLPDPEFHLEVNVRAGEYTDSSKKASLLFKEYETPKGTLRQVVCKTKDWMSEDHELWQPTTMYCHVPKTTEEIDLFDDWNVSRYVEPLIKGPQDLDKLTYLLNPPSGDNLKRWKEEALYAKKFAQKNNLLLRCRRTIETDAFQWFCSIPDFCIAMIEYPEYCHRLFRIVQDWQIKLLDLIWDIGVDVVMRRGWYDIPEFFGKERFNEFVKPFIEEDAALAHQNDTLFCNLLTKGTTHYLDAFKTMDVDICYGINEHGGDDLKLLKTELGSKTALWGGVDTEVTMIQGTPEDVRRVTKDVIGIFAPGSGFVFEPISAINKSIPWQNVEALIEARNEFGNYPKTI